MMWNAARGSDGRPPLTYNGAADVGDKCLGTGKHARLGAKLQGDPYVGDILEEGGGPGRGSQEVEGGGCQPQSQKPGVPGVE